MNIIKEIPKTLKNYFAPISRWTIVAIVAIATMMTFYKTAEATSHVKYEDYEIILLTHTQSPPIMPTKKIETNLYTEESHPDEYCIALNIYYEARADNLAGKYAVADVVLNRVEDKRFENTPCKVIREGIMYESWSTKQHKDLPDEERIYFPKRDKCQFSWFCDGKPDTPDHQASWRDAQIIAYNIVQFGTFRGITEGATHYHATYVAPNWSLAEWRPIYHLIGRVGEHIFYKWFYKDTSLSKS